MNGRLEKDLKVYKEIEDNLSLLPSFVSDWYYYLKANDKTASTCKDYIRKIRHFLSYIKEDVLNIDLNDITEDKVTRYFVDIKTKTKNENGNEIVEYTSDSYRQSIWSCLNNLFDFLEGKEKIPCNYITKLKIKRPKTKSVDVISNKKIMLTEDDFKKMLNAVESGVGSKKAKTYQRNFKTRDKCILEILMTTGMRKGALININIEDIDIDKQILTVIDKGEIIHEYKLSDSIMETLNRWLIERKFYTFETKTSALFVSRYGERISGNGIDKIISKYSYGALNQSISPHKIRAGFISIIQNKTHDIEFTRRAAGHKNISTTQRYVVTKNDEREKASLLMEELLCKEN